MAVDQRLRVSLLVGGDEGLEQAALLLIGVRPGDCVSSRWVSAGHSIHCAARSRGVMVHAGLGEIDL